MDVSKLRFAAIQCFREASIDRNVTRAALLTARGHQLAQLADDAEGIATSLIDPIGMTKPDKRRGLDRAAHPSNDKTTGHIQGGFGAESRLTR